MTADATPLDGCHCCEGLADPGPVHNDPGLPALRYRVDTQPGFRERMLQSLPLARADARQPGSPRPLRRLLTRSSDDPTVALIDACACVADVLAFYQERIANEGFLRTATERRSVLELARAIGYELKPGVAATVHLAFTVEDAPGAPGVCTLAAGTPVQSVPPQGKLPQVFETSVAIEARAEWNALRPRQGRPADLALLDVSDTGRARALALLGPSGSFPVDVPGLHQGIPSAGLFRLDPGLAIDDRVDALEVRRVYFTDAAAGIAGGDLLLFAATSGPRLGKLVLRVVDVATEPALKRVCVDLEPLPDPVQPLPPPVATGQAPYAVKQPVRFAQPLTSAVAFTDKTLATTVAGQAWRERDLQAMIGMQGWKAASLVKALSGLARSRVVRSETGAFAFRAKLGFFGHNAPKWAILPTNINGTLNDTPYPEGWDTGDATKSSPDGKLHAPRTIWQDSQGHRIAGPQAPHAYLERAVPDVTRASWVVVDAPDVAAEAFSVFDAREASRADYGLSGRAMALTLAGEGGQVLAQAPSAEFPFRGSTAHVASRRLELVELPIDVPVEAGATEIELDRTVLGLVAGQPVALTGERSDLPGVDDAEIAMLADVVHADRRSTLRLRQGLLHGYRRGSLRINANVVAATHGESVSEVLGNGDASRANQGFTLKKPPTTYLPAATTSGARSTLEVRVNGVLWDEVTSLHGAAPDEAVYATRVDDDARMQLVFGDGVQGARLPTGSLNVAARYRSGIGPDGEVDAGTLTMLRAMPLGLRSVTNPLAASGAEGPEQLAGARRNAPLKLLAFERVVSLLDYEDYARAYPGIGKTRGDVLWVDGAALVHLTVTGATGGAPGVDVLANLPGSIAQASDASQRFLVAAYVQRYFSCKVRVAVDPRYVAADVRSAVSAALLQAFGFDARALGQSVTAAEVLALIHTVAGVRGADLEGLLPYSDGSPPADAVTTSVPAFGARWNATARLAAPAELLLINPAAIEVLEMVP